MKLEIILSILNIKHVNILGKKSRKLTLRRLWSKMRLKFFDDLYEGVNYF